jgi:hypothetical protein
MTVFKTLQKRFCTKKHRVEMFLQKNRPICSRLFFNHVFGAFLGEGVQKIIRTLVLFWLLTHPPTTGVTGISFGAAPCGPRDLEPPNAKWHGVVVVDFVTWVAPE